MKKGKRFYWYWFLVHSVHVALALEVILFIGVLFSEGPGSVAHSRYGFAAAFLVVFFIMPIGFYRWISIDLPAYSWGLSYKEFYEKHWSKDT